MEFGLEKSSNLSLRPGLQRKNNNSYCPTMCYGILIVLWFVLNLFIGIFSIGFTIIGISVLSQDFNNIPCCAKSYVPWMIVMIVLYGLCFLGQTKRGIDGFTVDVDDPLLRQTIVAMLCVLGTITISGYKWVYLTSDSCDTSQVTSISNWIYRSIVYNLVVATMLLLVLFYSGYRSLL
jgi:hypothetical protein